MVKSYFLVNDWLSRYVTIYLRAVCKCVLHTVVFGSNSLATHFRFLLLKQLHLVRGCPRTVGIQISCIWGALCVFKQICFLF